MTRTKRLHEVGQLLFDFDAPLRPPKPSRQTDKEAFLDLQKRFVLGDSCAMNSAWILCDRVADKLISKEYTKKGLSILLVDRYDIKHEMLCQLFRRYKRNPEYRVHGSICAVLYDCMRNVIYHPHKLDRLMSLCEDIETVRKDEWRQ